MHREPIIGDVLQIFGVRGLQVVVQSNKEIQDHRCCTTFDTLSYYGLKGKLGVTLKKFQVYGGSLIVDGREIKNIVSDIEFAGTVKIQCVTSYSLKA